MGAGDRGAVFPHRGHSARAQSHLASTARCHSGKNRLQGSWAIVSMTGATRNGESDTCRFPTNIRWSNITIKIDAIFAPNPFWGYHTLFLGQYLHASAPRMNAP